MAKKSKRQGDIFDVIFNISMFIGMVIAITIRTTMKILLFIYDVITIYSTGYRKKSGNGFFKTYFNKGHMGEFLLFRKLSRITHKDNLFTNLYLPGQNTTHTELDIVLLSHKGIFLYEVKNYGGYIYGSRDDKYWTQVLRFIIKNKFFNPLRQNFAHHKALESYLGVGFAEIIPMISFSNRSKLSKIQVNMDSYVLQTKDTIKLTKQILKSGPVLFDETHLKQMRLKLTYATLKDQVFKDNHVNEVKAFVDK